MDNTDCSLFDVHYQHLFKIEPKLKVLGDGYKMKKILKINYR